MSARRSPGAGYGASAEQVLPSIPKEVVHLLTGW
jgi:hypothetical protein